MILRCRNLITVITENYTYVSFIVEYTTNIVTNALQAMLLLLLLLLSLYLIIILHFI